MSPLNTPLETSAATAEGDDLGLTPQQLTDFERDGACFERFPSRIRLFFYGVPIRRTPSKTSTPTHLESAPPPHPLFPTLPQPPPPPSGFLVIPDFASPHQVSSLLSRGRHLLATFDPASVASVFSTRDQSASVSAKYFAESASRVSFFFEEGAVVATKEEAEEAGGGSEAREGGGGDGEDGAAADGATLAAPSRPRAFSLSVPQERAVNKIGHALHDEDAAFRAFSREDPRLLALLRSLRFERPTPVQSMYICKPPRLGAEVAPHQDACFLRTEPMRSVAGCWLALERAGVDNGCLWAVPGSHRREVKEGGEAGGEDDGGGPFLGHGRVFGRREDGSVGWSSDRRGGGGGGGGEEEPSGPPEFSTEGAVPLEAAPGTLVVLDGAVVHFSRANDGGNDSLNQTSRHAYALHFVEGGKGVRWSERNWLQRDKEKPFVPVY